MIGQMIRIPYGQPIYHHPVYLAAVMDYGSGQTNLFGYDQIPVSQEGSVYDSLPGRVRDPERGFAVDIKGRVSGGGKVVLS